MKLFNIFKQKEKIYTVLEAKQILYDSLTKYTGWQFLKGQQCLRKKIEDMVFEIQFYSSKYNSSNVSVEINCEFLFWNRKYDNMCNINSKIGFIFFTPEKEYWYDISTETKINLTIKALKDKIDKYVKPLTNEFEKDYDKAIQYLSNKNIQEIYNLKKFKAFYKITNKDFPKD